MAGIGSTPALLVGTAVGGAAAAAFEPALEIPRQEAWAKAPNRVLDPGLLAALVAQGAVDLGTAESIAQLNGYAKPAFDPLVYLAQTVPGAAEAMHLWRLNLIDDALFTHVLIKGGLDERYVAPILATKTDEQLGLGDIAIAIVRGILPAPSYVPVPVPATGDKVPRYPVVNEDPEALAARIGYSPEALEIMVGRSGLSMAPVMAAQALFRGIIGPDDYLIAIGEGDLRTEWAAPVRDASRAIPSPGEEMEAALRGWQTKADGEAGAARHGMSQDDADLLYKIKRRPLNVHAITTGLARGGTFDAANAPFADPYESSVHEADLGPEWYDLAIANRYVYPSAFVLRTLAQAGELGDATAVEQILLEIGWKPELAAKVAATWAPTGSSSGPHAAKAETQLWGTTHTAYKNGEIGKTDATTNLTALGITAAEQADVFTYWDAERATIRKQLSVAQLQKAEKDGLTNPATKLPFTSADVIAALVDRGYDQNDAEVLAAGA